MLDCLSARTALITTAFVATVVFSPLVGPGVSAADDGGMIIGGPLNGSILPGAKGGMVIGGPANGSIIPPR